MVLFPRFRCASLAVLGSVLISIPPASTQEPVEFREDFAVESGQWTVIRRGGTTASREFAINEIVEENGKAVPVLHVRGTKENPAVGVAVTFTECPMEVVGMRLAVRFRVRVERTSGHSGVGGNSLFFGFARYAGGKPFEHDDDGFFVIVRPDAKPALIVDQDETMAFLSSGNKPSVGDLATSLSPQVWSEGEFEVKREENGFRVTVRFDGIDHEALFEDGGVPKVEYLSSFVIAQGGGGESPSDFFLQDVRVTRFPPLANAESGR